MAWEASFSLSPSSVTQISCRAQPEKEQHSLVQITGNSVKLKLQWRHQSKQLECFNTVYWCICSWNISSQKHDRLANLVRMRMSNIHKVTHGTFIVTLNTPLSTLMHENWWVMAQQELHLLEWLPALLAQSALLPSHCGLGSAVLSELKRTNMFDQPH